MHKHLSRKPLEGEYIPKGEGENELELDLSKLYQRTFVDLSFDCGVSMPYMESKPKVKSKPTFWQKVKARPWPYVLFCMQMFWPVVLIVYAIFFYRPE